MADEIFKVGSGFTLTCDTRDPETGDSLIDLTLCTGHGAYYLRPDGVEDFISADSNTADVIVVTITAIINPLTVSGGIEQWRNGYHGTWEIYPYCLGPGGIPFHGKTDFVVVHPQWRSKK